jgi:hypothetical protein
MDFNDSLFTSRLVSNAAKNETMGPQIKIQETIDQNHVTSNSSVTATNPDDE